jgi:Domain of unknown function (DUF6798)
MAADMTVHGTIKEIVSLNQAAAEACRVATNANPASETARSGWLRTALAFLFGVAVFATSHTQAPLYYSNQNQYFLHGLAQGGLGDLKIDWLANTTDPTPVFSALVAITFRYLHPWAFYVYYAILLGLYFVAIMGLIEFAHGGRLPLDRWLAAAFVICLVHSAALRFASVSWLSHDYPWYFQSGLAGQYLLGPGLQPSAFGLLLVASLHLYAARRPILASACAALAVVMHSTYAPTAAVLVVGYLFVLVRERQWRAALVSLGVSLLLTLPVIAWQILEFAPKHAEPFAMAQQILVHVRIPHHTLPAKWFNWIAGLQVIWIVAGIVAARKTVLFPIMTLMFLVSLLLTLIQLLIQNDTLALLFPWRSSALLVPVATAVLLGQVIRASGESSRPHARLIGAASILGTIALACAGAAIVYFGLAYHMNPEEEPLLNFVRTHRAAGDVYLLPIKSPTPGQGKRGVPSTSFTRPPRQDKDRHLIAVDFQRFRFDTGAAIVVDFKSIPYKDVDVLEWRERMRVCEWLYQQPDWDAPEVREALKRYGVTHVVATADRPLQGKQLELIYHDSAYRIYRLH